MQRRTFLKSLVAATALWALPALWVRAAAEANAPVMRLVKSREEWQKILTPQQFDILREEGTERSYTSPLNKEKRTGMFLCAGCDLALFSSATKYDSGTGWPSFYDFVPGHLETKTDYKIGLPRTEYHCARCGGHHGHVFRDGPPPTGLRYCSNGAVLKFVAG